MERSFWLNHAQLAARPLVIASRSLPDSLVNRLLTRKSAQAVRQKSGHEITELQGACHSLVIPVVFPVFMNGVTNYRNGRHILDPLPPNEPPFFVLSALVQPDVEFKSVMYEMIRLENRKIEGKALAHDATDYTDEKLKSNFVYHFTQHHEMPACCELSQEELASSMYLKKGRDVLNLGMLRNIIQEQIRIEMIALTSIAKKFDIKLVYTWDPPSIFAKSLGLEILDQLWYEAITRANTLSREIVCIGFNDFANKSMIRKLRKALPASVAVCSKSKIDLKPGQFKVLHSNGDAFGEHIRTQPCSTSLDGAIGSSSSAAASLCLRRPYPIVWA